MQFLWQRIFTILKDYLVTFYTGALKHAAILHRCSLTHAAIAMRPAGSAQRLSERVHCIELSKGLCDLEHFPDV